MLLSLCGCPTAGIYRTARTLNQGEVDLGLMVSATHVSIPETKTTDPSTGMTTTTTPATSFTFPNLWPEFTLHYGITDHVELGGRIALSALMAEVDLKLRLVGDRNAATHLALAPALGYRTLIIIEGAHATLPLILTHDLNRDLAINVAAYGTYRNLHATSTSSTNDLDSLAARALVFGGSVGLEVRGEKIYFMPLVDIARTVATFDQASGGTIDSVIIVLAFGVIPGRVGRPESRPYVGPGNPYPLGNPYSPGGQYPSPLPPPGYAPPAGSYPPPPKAYPPPPSPPAPSQPRSAAPP